ncbi:hypothetical protein JJB07_06180 [Tumebacillus sp. ITR2]|uniref:Uncharacterized protein n=1 Tax=Tumebacillus amylolyticus TaxID=2801339 RepID=A0ABS1J861_9BACL|nr:hypothetical protein [Tumebacillus amylolyticus]MBL0386239.1 hypothetical protein [Tumebacillus amylolyticus]
MILQSQAVQTMSNKGLTQTQDVVQSALENIDQQANFNIQRARRHVLIWDKQSSINGLDPKFIMDRYQISPDTNTYLLYLDDTLQVFQPYNPNQPGNIPMSSEEAMQFANQVADNMAWEDADQMTLDELFQVLSK